MLLLLNYVAANGQLQREVIFNDKVHMVRGEKVFERTKAYNSDEFVDVSQGLLLVNSVSYDGDVPSLLVVQEIKLTNLNFSAAEIQNMENDVVTPFKGAILYIDTTKKFAKKSKGTNYVSIVFANQEMAASTLQKLKSESKIKPTKSKK